MVATLAGLRPRTHRAISVSRGCSSPALWCGSLPGILLRSAILEKQETTIVLVPLGPVIQLSGQVADDGTSAPIAAATVSVDGNYRATTDASGKYSLTGRLGFGDSSYTFASADGYEVYTRYIRGNSAQNFRLRRIERILGGQSWSVTIHPDDSLCFSDFHEPALEPPGFGFLCRAVRVVTQITGILTVEAVSTKDGSHPPLEVQVLDPCSAVSRKWKIQSQPRCERERKWS